VILFKVALEGGDGGGALQFVEFQGNHRSSRTSSEIGPSLLLWRCCFKWKVSNGL
jgi:hypothetical protein